MSLPRAFREARGQDWNFVYGYWPAFYAAQRKGRTRKAVRASLKALAQRGGKFVVAYDPTDPDYIYGFGAAEDNVLHVIFVQEVYRMQGLGRELLAELNLGGCTRILCPNWTSAATKIAEKTDIFKRML